MIYSRTMSLWRRASLHLQVIRAKNQEIEILQQCILAHQHSMHDLAVAWRISLETPEIDIREDLDQMIREMHDNMAQTEEFVV